MLLHYGVFHKVMPPQAIGMDTASLNLKTGVCWRLWHTKLPRREQFRNEFHFFVPSPGLDYHPNQGKAIHRACPRYVRLWDSFCVSENVAWSSNGCSRDGSHIKFYLVWALKTDGEEE
jgi:hypothetical protein